MLTLKKIFLEYFLKLQPGSKNFLYNGIGSTFEFGIFCSTTVPIFGDDK